MTSLIFGANCSPFIAQYVKNRNAERFASSMPAAADAICNQHYMDDYLDSFPDEATATQMVRDIVYIHKAGGFEIRNWTSNSVVVLDSIPKETLGTVAVSLKMGQQCEGERTLGLIWFPAKDELGFDLSFKRIPEDVVNGAQVPTKRVMLRVIMSIYDIFGFLSPFTIQGKIMLQNLWRSNIGWDDEIPNSASETGDRIATDAADIVAGECSPAPLGPLTPAQPATASTRLTGSYETAHATSATTYDNTQLHVFCDASTKAMCAVAYWRWTCNGNVFVAFIASKCRVAPVKPLTVPRLELQAALLAARLADTIIREHKLSVLQRFFWSDSTTVLHWINNDAKNYKTFVANRLGEIDEVTSSKEWRYVPTELNVADIATRETYDDATFKSQWLGGPTFLRDDESSWPRHVVRPVTDVETIECVNLVTNVVSTDIPSVEPVPDPERFSSWLRLLRSTAAVLRFIRRCKKRSDDDYCELMEQAERLLFRRVQSEAFAAEVSAIREGKCLPRSSRILKLSPYLDEHGVLRCGGRIGAALDVSSETKNPSILDGRHRVTRLLVRHFHIKAAHGNQETVVNNLRQRYWIIKMRPTVKQVAAGCMICRIKKAKPEMPVMGDLPPARVAHHQRAFTHCGVDLFGPMEVVVGRRREKRYGVIFTCLTVRAIHLEIVHSLTTDSLIMALRRMAARRGWPRYLYSDNGTNLRGADAELLKSIQELDDETLKNEAANRAILKERIPKDEVLATFMTEVENIVNSRPLTHVSVEPGSNESLTPNHFLLGTSSNLPAAGVFDDSDLYLRKQWRKSQRLADMYWRRWVTEYLPELIPRRKWNEEREPLKVGDLVLVVDPGAPRNVWQRAIVQQISDPRRELTAAELAAACRRIADSGSVRVLSMCHVTNFLALIVPEQSLRTDGQTDMAKL
ncbi:hypothetical protein MSG28_006454 [Choristoneura fumiferana]|uniref:Uncharacterized protein n=1 Tax=Choristoneura fumiferana TaxID=7141 RepID=A0ACC0JF20_CHOFU|nr:hypothetical protein MSG28_006454 [Choristoneura fumiferana]